MPLTRLVIVGMATMSLGLGACVSSRLHRTAGETIDDTTLTARVKASLVADPATPARHIDVTVRRGIVQLNGFVDSASERAAALKTAQSVSGVTRVEDNLRIETRNYSAGETIDDTWITGKVKLALVADPMTKARQIEVSCNDGVVLLGGFVDDEAAKTRAGVVAARVEHVRNVDNRLSIKQ